MQASGKIQPSVAFVTCHLSLVFWFLYSLNAQWESRPASPACLPECQRVESQNAGKKGLACDVILPLIPRPRMNIKIMVAIAPNQLG